MPDDNLREGEPLSGRYRLTEQVADDERGDLWMGVDDRTGREVVIRVLRPAAVGPEMAALLGRVVALHHESILPLLTFDLESSVPHVVYEGAGGTPLSAFLAEGAIPWDSACEIGAQVLEALAHIHEHGLAYGAFRPQSVWLTGDGRAVLGDAGLHTAPAPRPPSEEAPAAGGDGLRADTTPRADLAALGAFLHLLITPSGAPDAVAGFIARCRGEDAAAPFIDAQEACDALREIMRRELAEASVPGPVEAPGADAPDRPERPAAPGGEDLSARIRDLERRLRGSGRTPELEAELGRLRETHGCAQLRRLAGVKGKAVLGRHDAANRATVAVFVAGCALGFGLLWWIVDSYLRTVPLNETLRATLTYLALAAYVVVGVWVAAALLLTRTRRACYVVISDSEILCHDESKGLMVASLAASEIRSVALLSFDDSAPEQTVADIEIWGGGKLRLDFAARAHENEKRGGSS